MIFPVVKKISIVIDNMVTWFDAKTMEVMARNYHLSYDAGVYDFDVQMEVQMTKFGDYLVPKILRYKGNWDVIFKKRERGAFTATLFDFISRHQQSTVGKKRIFKNRVMTLIAGNCRPVTADCRLYIFSISQSPAPYHPAAVFQKKFFIQYPDG